MAILNFDYPKALRQASEIENVANSMRSLASNGLDNAYEAIASVWKGDTANLYIILQYFHIFPSTTEMSYGLH
jgi:hypothetical protein